MRNATNLSSSIIIRSPFLKDKSSSVLASKSYRADTTFASKKRFLLQNSTTNCTELAQL